MPYLMRLNRDVDDFKLGSDEDGDVTLTCPHGDCGVIAVFVFDVPSMGRAIQAAYEHLDEDHPALTNAPPTPAEQEAAGQQRLGAA